MLTEQELDDAIDKMKIQNEAFRLGCESGFSKPEQCVEMRALLDACESAEEKRMAVRWFAMGVLVKA
jgi:hypothetical protein